MLLPPGGKNWQLAFNCYNIKIHEKKNIQIGPETTKLDFCGQDSHLGKVQYSNFQVKEKKQ